MKHSQKRRHPTEESAIAAALRLSKRRGYPLRVYACEECGGWHLTSWTTRRPTARA